MKYPSVYVEAFKVLNFVAISVLWTRGLRGAEVNDDWSRFLTILTLTRSDLGGDGSVGSGPGRGAAASTWTRDTWPLQRCRSARGDT